MGCLGPQLHQPLGDVLQEPVNGRGQLEGHLQGGCSVGYLVGRLEDSYNEGLKVRQNKGRITHFVIFLKACSQNYKKVRVVLNFCLSK